MQNNPFEQFRDELYRNFNKRADSKLDLLDALSSHRGCRSVVELSQTAQFRRKYSSVYDSIRTLELSNQQLSRLASRQIKTEAAGYYHLCVDVTPNPRPTANCLEDRGYVYNGTSRGVSIGHQYSAVMSLPQLEEGPTTWAIPVAVSRAPSYMDKELLGARQVAELLGDSDLPFIQKTVVLSGDSYYAKPAFLSTLLTHENGENENLVLLVRSRSDRVFYCSPTVDQQPSGRGRKRCFGERFDLSNPETWPQAELTWKGKDLSKRGEELTVELSAWFEMLMRGKRRPFQMPMERHPFTLIRVKVTKADGSPAYRRPLWLILMGHRRREFSPKQALDLFSQRFRQEHAFRFLKQRLLLTDFQTPNAKLEEQWWRFVSLAYLQLWVARPLITSLPRPWERYLPRFKKGSNADASPTDVMRGMAAFLALFVTPARSPKPRGNSTGRAVGMRLTPRIRHPVVRKHPKPA